MRSFARITLVQSSTPIVRTRVRVGMRVRSRCVCLRDGEVREKDRASGAGARARACKTCCAIDRILAKCITASMLRRSALFHRYPEATDCGMVSKSVAVPKVPAWTCCAASSTGHTTCTQLKATRGSQSRCQMPLARALAWMSCIQRRIRVTLAASGTPIIRSRHH